MYLTANEFIYALKCVSEWQEKKIAIQKEIDKLNYLLYEKVKSPLDYDIVGYKNNEAMRSIKTGRTPSQSEILDQREKLNNKLDNLIKQKNEIKKKISEVKETLSMINEPLKSILIEAFINKESYSAIAKKRNFKNKMALSRFIYENTNKLLSDINQK